MIALVPSWAIHYDEFWEAIKRRNLWFIKLRYGAVVMLFTFWISAEYLLDFSFSKTQYSAILLINISIFIYNIFLHILRKSLKCAPGQFNPLHFSLLQMVLDLTALSLLIYFTGSIESPLFLLFIFHMIIGSLILPGWVIYSVAVALIFLFNGLVFGEYFGIITHHAINGLLSTSLYDNFNFVISYTTVFSFVMFMSVVLANRIANQLYKMEQKLVESLNQLNAAETEKQKYIIGLVHEIKSPIAAVHSYLDLILQKYLGPLNAQVEEKLKRAKIRAGEAIQMINDVLKISRLRLLDEINKEEIDIKQVICSILNKQKINIETKKIKMNFSDQRSIKKNVSADEFLLELAFSNLIGNAIKYVDREGKIIIRIVNAENGYKIEVSDNGIGIPKEDINKIFNDFYRASNIKQKGYEGSGLGLSIIKQIVERHGGTISVQSPSILASKDNPGSSFFIYLPYENSEAKKAESQK